jgi:glucose-6-phosphate 1-epimerase
MKPIEISSGDARAEAYVHGAHVVSWRPTPADERLFLSARSRIEPGAAIRGGIPVIFPQFSTLGPLPKHGFARTSEWTLVDSGAGFATFRLGASAATLALWPHEFIAEVAVRVGGASLEVQLAVDNSGDAPFEFTAALHSYVRVADVQQVRVRGLEGLRYRDSTAGGIQRVQREADLAIAGEVDRIYLDVVNPVEVREPGRVTRAHMTGFRDVVVWNPGPAADATMRDMEPRGYQRMLCVEAAIAGAPVRLAPGERWTGTQALTAA